MTAFNNPESVQPLVQAVFRQKNRDRLLGTCPIHSLLTADQCGVILRLFQPAIAIRLSIMMICAHSPRVGMGLAAV